MPRPKQNSLVRLEIRLTELQADRLKTICDSQYRTKVSIVLQALDEFFMKTGNVFK